MKWEHIHLIDNDKVKIAYHYPSSQIILLNHNSLNILKLLKNKASKAAVIAGAQLESQGNVSSFIDSLENSFHDNSSKENPQKSNVKKISRITLHVSNDCNLRCRYCYAGGGNYKQQRKLMSLQTAHDFVDFCISSFDQINQIVFFGGEPLLNVEIMDYICNQFKTYYKEGKSSFIPKFGMITNGTILTPRILQFINDHLTSMTVSIDGPQDINDANRIYKNGNGSFKDIKHFIHTILNKTKVNLKYEATFTQAHIDSQYTHRDIADALEAEFGIKGIIVDENIGKNANQVLHDLEDISYENIIKTDFSTLPSEFWLVLEAIVYNKPIPLCPIIKNMFAISADGEIYACQMINGEKNNSLGYINGNNIFNTPLEYASMTFKMDLKANEICQICWAQKLCGGCAVQKFYDYTKASFMKTPKIELCNSTQQILEQILQNIVLMKQDPKIWAALIKKVKNI